MRNNLLWILPVFIFYVLSFSIVPTYKDFQKKFAGDAENFTYPGFNKQSLTSHTFQQYVEKLFEQKIRFRHKLVAFSNQLYYSVFKKSFADNNGLIIGKNNQLFEMPYLIAYCQKKIDNTGLIAWADKVKKINDLLVAKGKVFIYLNTPSKAEYMPEMIPDRFHCKRKTPDIYQFDQLLTERKIPHVNGTDLTFKAAEQYHMPMFTFGGIHWNRLGAITSAKAIIDIINQRIPLSDFSFSYSMGRIGHHDSENDLLKIANVIRPKKQYPVPHIQFNSTKKMENMPTLAIVGGSFNEKLLELFQNKPLFSKMDYFWYFTRRYNQYIDLLSNQVSVSEVLQADVIILEENSSMLISDHGKRFYESLIQSQ